MRPRRVDLALPGGREWLVLITERDIDVEATLENPSANAVAGREANDVTRVDTPVERAGSMHALISAGATPATAHATLMVSPPKGPPRPLGPSTSRYTLFPRREMALRRLDSRIVCRRVGSFARSRRACARSRSYS